MAREFTEQDAYIALGLGERVQEPAAPAPGDHIEPTSSNSGERVQEPAVPAGQEPATPIAQVSNGEGDGQPLTQEQRRENAARRRREEQQRAVDEAVQAEQVKNASAIKGVFEKLGLKDPVTGSQISTMEEFETYQANLARQKLERDLAQGKLTPEGLQQAISDHPAIQAAQQAQQQRQQAQEEAALQETQAKVTAQLAEIQKLNPEIKTVEDLLSMPNAKEFYALVQRGNSLSDAYKLACFDQIMGKKAEQAQIQAQNLARSKGHLTPDVSRGEGAVTVPKDVMADYRRMMPKATDEQIQNHYAKYLKNRKGG